MELALHHTLPTLRLLIVDDHQVVRQGIRLMLSAPNRYYHFLVEEAITGQEAYDMIFHKSYDLIIMDYQLLDISGDRAISQIVARLPSMKIIVLSNYNETLYIEKAVSSGAKGYVLKSIETPELMLAIRTAMDGGEYFSNEVHIKRRELENRKTAHGLSRAHGLTPRELEVLQLIAWGETNKIIAQKLFVSMRTVETHRKHLLQKLQVKNAAELITTAHKLKLVE